MTAEILRLMTERALVSAGKMAALNLEEFKSRLGGKWEKLSTLVHTLFEAEIKRSMKQGDAYFKAGDLAYIVIYRDLSVEETQIRCAALSRQVCTHLFGEEGMEIAVRSVVGQIDHSMLRGFKNLESAINDSLERYGTETIISLTDRKPAASLSPQSREIELTFTQQPRIRLSCATDELSFVYRPIWDCNQNVILSYLCQPIAPCQTDVATNYTAGFCTSTGGDEDRSLLDRTVLAHILGHMQKLRERGSRVLLAVPLHFTTLARQRAWTEYKAILRTISREVLRDIVFFVFDLHDVPNIRLVQELPKLSGARHVFCAIERNDPVVRFASTSVNGIGSELPNRPLIENETIGYIKSLSSEARQHGFDSFVLGLESTSRVLAAMAAGIRYLEGPAIHPVVNDPRHAFVHELEDLYAKRAAP